MVNRALRVRAILQLGNGGRAGGVTENLTATICSFPTHQCRKAYFWASAPWPAPLVQLQE